MKDSSERQSETSTGRSSKDDFVLAAGRKSDKPGVIVSYPDRTYADQRALTLLSQLREHLPNADYGEVLPAQIMDCCTEIRTRSRFELTAPLEMTFDVGEHSIHFRVLSLSPKQLSDASPVLVLLDLISL